MSALPLIATWIRHARSDTPALILPDGTTLCFRDLVVNTAGQPNPGRNTDPYNGQGLRALEGSATVLVRGLIDAALNGSTAFPLPPNLDPAHRRSLLAQASTISTPKLALIIATSGSSGKPKGVRLSWRAIAAASRMSARVLDLQPGDAWLACLPLYHIGGAMILYRCLRASATAVVHEGFDIAAIAHDLATRHITHLSLVPPMLARLLEAGISPSPSLKYVLVGGAALNDTLLERACAAGWPIHTSWGMSETCATSTVDGRPLPGVRVRIGATGTLEVATPARMTGYLGEANADEWLTTHDLGQIDGNGHVHIQGRADDMLISGGNNIHPLDVEARLAACPGVREAGVTGLDDPLWGNLIACVYEGQIQESALSDWCRAHLPSSHRPRRLLQVTELPRLTSGKLDRRALLTLLKGVTHSHPSLVNWHWVADELKQLAHDTPKTHLLSITLLLSHWPDSAHLPPTDGVFWQRPNANQRILGIGHACQISSAGAGRFTALNAAHRGLIKTWRYRHESPPPLAFTGFAFAPQGGHPFQNATLWVPELLLREQEGQIWLTLTCPAAAAHHALARWQSCWETLLTPSKDTGHSTPSFVPDPIADSLFRARGRAALDAITVGIVEKLVLTRTQQIDNGTPIVPHAILSALAVQQPNCAIYGVSHKSLVFMGASPETLLTLHGDQVGVDALAGTAWYEAALPLENDKNRREHDFVAQAVAEALAPLCRDICIPTTPEIMQLRSLSHLRRRVVAKRLASAQVFDFIARLHPTSAVGGVPREAALAWLARHGDVRSAWYTGGIGWIDARGNCDIAVALRCGLFDGHKITLQAGAGFVAGSDVAQEFAETEAKFHTLHDAILLACKSPEIA